MPTGDPTWKCQHCGAVYYVANRVWGNCNCAASQVTQSHCSTFVIPENVDHLTKVFDQFLLSENKSDTKILINDMADTHHPETLVVNLFGGPGAGKSTTAAGIFFELKTQNINCELVGEFAKDLVWEKRHKTFEDQIYIFGKQYHRIHRLMGQVSVVIVDSPLLLTPIYDSEKRKTLEQLVVEEHNKMWTYNVFLKRKKAFNQSGRTQDKEKAEELDSKIVNMLFTHDILFETFEGTPDGRDKIIKKILTLLSWNEGKSLLES